jgi:hypothetical protein
VQNGDFNEIREILKNIAILQAQHEEILLQHSEAIRQHDEAIRQHDAAIQQHDAVIAGVDETLSRAVRHLEVHSILIDDLIRHKADRKNR